MFAVYLLTVNFTSGLLPFRSCLKSSVCWRFQTANTHAWRRCSWCRKHVFLEIAAHPKISRNLNTLAGSEPENNIAAERRRLPTGACFIMIGWLSHLNVDKQAGHVWVTLTKVPMVLVIVVVDSALPHFWHLLNRESKRSSKSRNFLLLW